MTTQDKNNYYDDFHKELNKFAPLSGSGKNDKLIGSLLSSFINQSLQALEQGGITTAQFSTYLIGSDRFRQIFEQLYHQTGLHFAEWQYKRIKAGLKRENTSLNVGFMSETYRMLISKLLSSPIMAERITNITDETKNQIRSILQEANDRNLDVRQTASLLRQKVPSIVKSRSLLISRTETTLAASLGAQFGAKQTRLKLNKVWIATRDSRTRDAHRSMLNHKPVPQGEKFSVGGTKMLFPGDPAGGARNCCNCRCTVAFIPAEEQEEVQSNDGFNPLLYVVGGIILDELLS